MRGSSEPQTDPSQPAVSISGRDKQVRTLSGMDDSHAVRWQLLSVSLSGDKW